MSELKFQKITIRNPRGLNVKGLLIYKFTNKKNGKIYVGKTTNLRQRMGTYNYCIRDYGFKPTYFYRALKKYGFDSFDVELVMECATEDELKQAEIEMISALKACDRRFGYNTTVGGDGGKLPDEVKELSPAQKKLIIKEYCENFKSAKQVKSIADQQLGKITNYGKIKEFLRKEGLIRGKGTPSQIKPKGKESPMFVRLTDEQKQIIEEEYARTRSMKQTMRFVNGRTGSRLGLSKIINHLREKNMVQKRQAATPRKSRGVQITPDAQKIIEREYVKNLRSVGATRETLLRELGETPCQAVVTDYLRDRGLLRTQKQAAGLKKGLKAHEISESAAAAAAARDRGSFLEGEVLEWCIAARRDHKLSIDQINKQIREKFGIRCSDRVIKRNLERVGALVPINDEWRARQAEARRRWHHERKNQQKR